MHMKLAIGVQTKSGPSDQCREAGSRRIRGPRKQMKAPKTTRSGSSDQRRKARIVYIKQIGRKDKRQTRFCNCPSNSAIGGERNPEISLRRKGGSPKVKKEASGLSLNSSNVNPLGSTKAEVSDLHTCFSMASTSAGDAYSYQVFLSFRGADTRTNFTDHLYTALVANGIRTFRDNEGVEKGGEIKLHLIKAIELSRISVIVLSKNYAHSKWCLEELLKIVESNQEGNDTKWRSALREVANLAGYELQTEYESEIVTRIVQDILSKLMCEHLHVDEKLHFLANIREIFKENRGLLRLQKKLLRDAQVLGVNEKLTTFDEGINMIKSRLCHKKVLVVLDDADHWSQLKSLVGKRDWFGEGSKIIITTRNKHLLIEHEMDELYEPPMLNTNEALDLFSEYAFRRNHRHDDYLSLSNRIIYYCQGLPFALKVLGSSLFSKTHGQWKSELDKLAIEPNMDIINVLRISYEGLSNTQKNIFLDIACFFKGEYKDFVIKILDGCGFFAESGIGLWMHDLIQQLGWEIVREQGYTNIGEGTNAIEGIFLDLPKSCQINFTTEALAMMMNSDYSKLEVLDYFGHVNLPETLNFLLTIHSRRFSLVTLLFPNLIIELNHSKGLRLILQGCTSLLEVHPSIGELEKLHLLDLKDCKSLESVPDGICKLKSLETLSLSVCCFLRNDAIPIDFWCLSSLQKLNLSGNNFTVIPEGITQLSKLRVLQLGHCYMLQEMPQLPSSIQEVDANSCMSSEIYQLHQGLLGSYIANKTLMETILERIQVALSLSLSLQRILYPTSRKGSSELVQSSGYWIFNNNRVVSGLPATHSEISCQSNNFSFFYSYPDPQTAFSSYHVWLAYQPRSRVDICHPDEWTDIKASFEINGVPDLIQKCGICPIYAHDHKKDSDDTEYPVKVELVSHTLPSSHQWTDDSTQGKTP
ncbi:hypothetical protein AAG906_000887 [Vitis piasezkii]